MPTKIIYGEDSFNSIDRFINGRKALLITSQGFIKRGLIEKLESLTDSIVGVITAVKSHPEFKDLQTIYNKIINYDFELILAIGGGSVIDASKFFSVQNHNKDYQFVEGIVKGKLPKKDYSLIPIISVPTTAGTGSEITPWATIWDMDEKKKYSLHLPNLFSEVAIYDPKLTLSVPKEITVQTGLDTLSHALESIWNKNASEITVTYAIKSAKLITENLFYLSNNLDNLTRRDKIMKACMYAGLAFSNTQTAIAHGLSYYITTNHGINHGIACSFTLPRLIDNVIGKFPFIDDALVQIFGELSSCKLRKLLKKLQISTKFSSYGIDKTQFEKIKNLLQNNQRAGNSLVDI
ncbi:Alcohol dehydrogenase [hydrothermal vent metagenome]|uniref:Alcohol dehydrogenase n=1 Tax=hydrothermal vent metagenome TaxID=652676 RepID=A0A3B0VLP9_9ZZZZ